MKIKLLATSALVGAVSLVVAATAGAAVTVPTVPVSAYGDQILTSLGTGVAAVFPYAAGVTAFVVIVGMVRRWIGHRRATGA